MSRSIVVPIIRNASPTIAATLGVDARGAVRRTSSARSRDGSRARLLTRRQRRQDGVGALFVATFPTSIWLGWLAPAAAFALFHFAPLRATGGVEKRHAGFLVGAVLIGLGYGWVAFSTGSVIFTIFTHTLVDACGIDAARVALGVPHRPTRALAGPTVASPARVDRDRKIGQSGWGSMLVLVVVVAALGWATLSQMSLRRVSSRFVPVAVSHPTMALSSEARARLCPRMRRHALAMKVLTDAVMSFDDERVIRAATEVLDEPEAVRPLTSQAAATDAELPATFHGLESALQSSASALLSAARAHDGERLTAANADLAWTCARCHAEFAGP